MRILAIDPGPTESAFLLYKPGEIVAWRKGRNAELLDEWRYMEYDTLAVEMVACYGMPVGAEVFETCVWVGRFAQALAYAHHSRGGRDAAGRLDPVPCSFVYRRTVKELLCGSMRAKDANIRQALIDLFGGRDAIGHKATPGPLYGLTGDGWAALAVAVTVAGLDSVAKPAQLAIAA